MKHFLLKLVAIHGLHILHSTPWMAAFSRFWGSQVFIDQATASWEHWSTWSSVRHAQLRRCAKIPPKISPLAQTCHDRHAQWWQCCGCPKRVGVFLITWDFWGGSWFDVRWASLSMMPGLSKVATCLASLGATRTSVSKWKSLENFHGNAQPNENMLDSQEERTTWVSLRILWEENTMKQSLKNHRDSRFACFFEQIDHDEAQQLEDPIKKGGPRYMPRLLSFFVRVLVFLFLVFSFLLALFFCLLFLFRTCRVRTLFDCRCYKLHFELIFVLDCLPFQVAFHLPAPARREAENALNCRHSVAKAFRCFPKAVIYFEIFWRLLDVYEDSRVLIHS